ncbi:MAG: bifunctional precorrin-2 dehydrogenase/sirohydrochlorin ferrochelatase [candidate division Zixibacteria bacterium]|nr:bifunctional precorrin-2 dehydrogenase/sirohydrochlorin ferrochelatase [candidate division Zixibacteria bacterium]
MYYPIYIKIKNQKCLIVGAGRVALRKAGTLLNGGAEITVVAPEAIDEIIQLKNDGKLSLHLRKYRSPEVTDYNIVISASDDENVNRAVAGDCFKYKIPVNVVDRPELCSFIVPAIVRRNDITIAISTGGKAPFLAKQIRKDLDKTLPRFWDDLSKIAGVFREKVMERYGDDSASKSRCFERFFAIDWQKLIDDGDEDAIERNINHLLEGE